MIFKKISGFENYSINNNGIVINSKFNKELKQAINKQGYHHVYLYKKGRTKCFCVHRLVYENFIGEILKPEIIVHKDGNKSNNNISNLTTSYNKGNMKKPTPIIQLLNNKKINEFKSIAEASKVTGIDITSLSNASNGKISTLRGFTWVKK